MLGQSYDAPSDNIHDRTKLARTSIRDPRYRTPFSSNPSATVYPFRSFSSYRPIFVSRLVADATNAYPPYFLDICLLPLVDFWCHANLWSFSILFCFLRRLTDDTIFFDRIECYKWSNIDDKKLLVFLGPSGRPRIYLWHFLLRHFLHGTLSFLHVSLIIRIEIFDSRGTNYVISKQSSKVTSVSLLRLCYVRVCARARSSRRVRYTVPELRNVCSTRSHDRSNYL